jgi:hypothetical protein
VPLCGEQFQKAYSGHVEHTYLRHSHELNSITDRIARYQKKLKMCNNALNALNAYQLQQEIQQCMNIMNSISQKSQRSK